MNAPPWFGILGETLDACLAHGRPDLAGRLRLRRDAPVAGTRLAVAGFSKQGKSYLVNALLNAPVCWVGDTAGTTVPTEVHHAAEAGAVLVHRDERISAGGEREPVDVERVAAEVSGAERPDLRCAEVRLPRELLAGGLVLIDTPAIGDPRSARTAAVLEVLAGAHAVLLVSDAGQELTGAELALAEHVRGWCPSVLVVLTKIDVNPDWREVAERDRALLREAGVDAPLVPVSSTVRLAAARDQDRETNAWSGFPELLAWVTAEAARPPEETGRRVGVLTARSALEDLVSTLKDELRAGDPRGADRLGELQRAQRRIDVLRRHTTRWQNLLSDEITDLSADLEYDLRERTRKIVQHIDRTFDEADPLQVWDEFAVWLEDSLVEAIETNYRWLTERAEWIANAVAGSFGKEAGQSVAALRLVDAGPGTETMEDLPNPRVERFRIGQKMFTGLRGSYGGVLMFGLITSLGGLPLINPLSLGAGAAFATKSVRDESETRLKRRQSIAKSAAQRHVDDVFLRFSKECKDLVRTVQRRLRDHFATLSEEMLDEAAAAREALQAGAAQRDRRNAELKREIERLAALHQRAGTLGAARLERRGGTRELSA
ncbi:dynamin family protein [Amycolatopsis nigrescens]|uniref:dynamin family protein n=1 Tax=Amycolatopsis nigrescens TaxID=381445 RepID=UPI00037CF378|nr:dynamin family protein [Amycolatopsis nigrescens]